MSFEVQNFIVIHRTWPHSKYQLVPCLQGGPVFDTFKGHSQKNHPCSAWFLGAQGPHGHEGTALRCLCCAPEEIFKALWGTEPRHLLRCAIQQMLHFYYPAVIGTVWLNTSKCSLGGRSLLPIFCFLNDLNCLGKEASILNPHPTRGDSHNNKV